MADLKRRIIAEFSAKNKAKGEMAAFRSDMDKTGQAMKRMATGALAMVGLGGGLYAIKRGFDYVTKAAMKQEDALFLLESALKAAGEYTADTMKKFEAFAASIQKATVYGDEEVLSLMQLMKSLGVTSTGLEQATKMAIGLAAATGRDVRSMSMYIALAQQGEFTMLRRYIPALRSTTDATKQLQIITEFAARGFKIAEAQAETTSGSITKMWNAVSDLAEVMAEPYLEPAAKDMRGLTIIIEGATEALKKYHKTWKEVRESREKFGLRPMGFPRVPMPDLEERFKGRETLGGQVLPMPEVIRFEEPEWYKDTLALNIMTETQKKAAASMYEMSMKARGLGEELAREKKITQFAALAKERYGADVAGAQAAIERFTKALKESEAAKRQEEDTKKATKRIGELADAYRSMRGQMGKMTRDVYDAEMAALDDLKEKYIELGADRVTIDKWYAEQAEVLRIEYLKTTDDIANGFEAAGMQIKREMATWGERAYEFSMTFQDSIASGLERSMRDFENWKDHLLNMFEEIYWAAARIAFIEPAAGMLAKGFTAIGGLVFGVPAPSGEFPTTAHGVPYNPDLQHGGKVLETGWAKIHRGETFSGVQGDGGGDTHVHIHNEQGEDREVSHVEQYMVSDQRIIDVFTRKAQIDGPLRRSIKQATR